MNIVLVVFLFISNLLKNCIQIPYHLLYFVIEYFNKMNNKDYTCVYDKKYLLDMDTNDMNNRNIKYNTLELFIYNLVKFQMEKKGILDDDKKYYITFILEYNPMKKLNIQYDEYAKVYTNKFMYPILSSVTFFEEQKNPFLFTFLDFDNYKYKIYENQNYCAFVFPKKFQTIQFDGSKYFGETVVFEENSTTKNPRLIINVFEDLPEKVEIYNNKLEKNKIRSDLVFNNENVVDLIISQENVIGNTSEIIIDRNDTMGDLFFNELFYSNELTRQNILQDIFENMNQYKSKDNPIEINESNNNIISTKITYNKIEQVKTYEALIKKFNVALITDVYEVHKNMELSKTNRYAKQIVINDIMNKAYCEWLIGEFERSVKTANTSLIYDKNYIFTNLSSLNHLVRPTLCLLTSLFDKLNVINSSVNLSYNINEIFIIKYCNNTDLKTDVKDGESFKKKSDINIVILLNQNSMDYSGFFFEKNNKCFHLNIGEALIFNNSNSYNDIEIKDGEIYILYISLSLRP